MKLVTTGAAVSPAPLVIGTWVSMAPAPVKAPLAPVMPVPDVLIRV